MCRTTWHVIVPAPEDATPHPDSPSDDAASAVVCMVERTLRGDDAPTVQAHDIAVGCLESSRYMML